MTEKHKMIELYLQFRRELDKICVPEILKLNQPRLIKENGEVVGLICASPDYIDCIYILPEHRRKGIAKKTLLAHWEDNKNYDMRLHIINNNGPALKFWKSIFKLENIGGNEIDTLYRIRDVSRKHNDVEGETND